MINDRYQDMSLFDWFAGMAMQSYVRVFSSDKKMAAEMERITELELPDIIATWSYDVAEAMLNQREKLFEEKFNES